MIDGIVKYTVGYTAIDLKAMIQSACNYERYKNAIFFKVLTLKIMTDIYQISEEKPMFDKDIKVTIKKYSTSKEIKDSLNIECQGKDYNLNELYKVISPCVKNKLDEGKKKVLEMRRQQRKTILDICCSIYPCVLNKNDKKELKNS